MDDIISLSDFMNRCRRHERYIGHVIGLGYVSGWKVEQIVTERPANNTKALTGNAQFIQTVYVPIITHSPFTNLLNSDILNSEYTDKARGASWGGVAATAGTIIDRALVMEPKYVRVNLQGTQIHNPNYGKVKVGTAKIAGGLGWGFLGLSIYYDVKAFDNNEITGKEALVDIVANGVIFTIGLANPVLGVVLGILYMSFTAPTGRAIGATYEEIHGTLTPADNTRVYKAPPKELLKPITKYQEVPAPKPPPVLTRGR